MNEENYKVLVVEDDQEQINLLLNDQPENVEITVVSTGAEANKLIKNEEEEWDFILTDLCLPWGESWSDLREEFFFDKKVSPLVGESLFEELLKMYVSGEVKGGALVTNFESHRDQDSQVQKIIGDILKKDKCFNRSPERKNALNTRISKRSWYNVKKWLLDGRLIETDNPQEFKEAFFAEKAKIAKPYKEVIEQLIENQP